MEDEAIAGISGGKPAGFWVRLCAHIIDTIIFSMIVVPLLFAIYWDDIWAQAKTQAQMAANNPALATSFDSSSVITGPAAFIIQYVLPAIAVILLWRWRAATPGKMLLKLKIIDARNGGKPTTGHLTIRYFSYFLSMIPLCLGFLWVGWDRRKQGWHDKLAGTLVVQH